MHDLGKAQARGPVFAPAIQPFFASQIETPEAQLNGRSFPAGLAPSDLNFLNPASKLFTLRYALVSAGWAVCKNRQPDLLEKRDRQATTLIGDSGGFQVIGGQLGDLNDALRHRILRWLEEYCDIGMTLDVPTAAIANDANEYGSFDECLGTTLRNLDYFATNRQNKGLRLLNVLQGRKRLEADKWYEAVKDYPFEGWAFAGATKGDLCQLTRRIIRIHQDGLLKGRAWVHVLGIASPAFVVCLGYLQDVIREHLDPDFTFSFDVSSPFLVTKYRCAYTQGVVSTSGCSLITAEMPDLKRYVGSTTPWQFSSPLGQRASWGDLCVLNATVQTTSHDTMSYALMANNNVFVQTDMLQRARTYSQLADASAKAFLPANVIAARRALEYVFSAPQWEDNLKKVCPTLKTAFPWGDEAYPWEEGDCER